MSVHTSKATREKRKRLGKKRSKSKWTKTLTVKLYSYRSIALPHFGHIIHSEHDCIFHLNTHAKLNLAFNLINNNKKSRIIIYLRCFTKFSSVCVARQFECLVCCAARCVCCTSTSGQALYVMFCMLRCSRAHNIYILEKNTKRWAKWKTKSKTTTTTHG